MCTPMSQMANMLHALPAGYFQAPAASYCPLGRTIVNFILPEITIVFCCVERIAQMKASTQLRSAEPAAQKYSVHVQV